MKKYTSPAVEEIKLTGIETIAEGGAGAGQEGSGVVNPSGR